MGSGNPFSENMVENLLDARKRLLKTGGRIVPNLFEIYLEPIQLNEAGRVPFLWELSVKSIHFASLRDASAYLPATGKPILPYHRMVVYPCDLEQCLCDPIPIIRFDLETMNQDDIPTRIAYRNTAVRDGRIDGICIYFKAFFDQEVIIDSSLSGMTTNWGRYMYRIEATGVNAGEAVEYDLEIGSLINDGTWALSWLEPKARSPLRN
jgi:protein arginine N-methyltransferase 1